MGIAYRTQTANLPTKFGNPSIKNIVERYSNGAEMFYSYGHLIAARRDGETHYTNLWDASTTTSQYRRRFTGYTTAQTEKAIRKGESRVMSSADMQQWALEV